MRLSLSGNTFQPRLENDAQADLYYAAGVSLICGFTKGSSRNASVVNVDVRQVGSATGDGTADTRLWMIQDVESLATKLQ